MKAKSIRIWKNITKPPVNQECERIELRVPLEIRKFLLTSLLLLFSYFVHNSSVLAKPFPFQLQNGLLILEAKINDSIPAKFALDTGSDRIYIDKQFALDNNIEFTKKFPQRNISGLSGNSEPLPLLLNSLVVGEQSSRTNVVATAIDLKGIVQGEIKSSADGLLGYDFFKEYYLTIDFADFKISLDTAYPGWLKDGSFTIIPFKMYKHFIIVDVLISDTVEASMIIDCGASYSAISPDIAARAGLKAESDKLQLIDKIEIRDKFLIKDMPIYVNELKKLRNSISDININGFIGNSFLRNFKICVDYENRRLFFIKI